MFSQNTILLFTIQFNANRVYGRLRTTLGDKVGMRMGFGIKDETDETVITFVTTGYIVRLLGKLIRPFLHRTILIRYIRSNFIEYFCCLLYILYIY